MTLNPATEPDLPCPPDIRLRWKGEPEAAPLALIATENESCRSKLRDAVVCRIMCLLIRHSLCTHALTHSLTYSLTHSMSRSKNNGTHTPPLQRAPHAKLVVDMSSEHVVTSAMVRQGVGRGKDQKPGRLPSRLPCPAKRTGDQIIQVL